MFLSRTYYGSFVSGLQDVAAGVVRERLDDAVILKLLDGAIIFETSVPYDMLNFICFNNIFAVIDIFEMKTVASGFSPTAAPELHIRKLCASGKNSANRSALSQKALDAIGNNNRKIQSFRLIFSSENEPISVDESLKRNMEQFIGDISALKTERAKADTEFWFLYRREGFSVFMKRLTVNARKKPYPGELPVPLAWLLCRIAALKPGETAADPFCGYGSIPEAALKFFPIKKFYASDEDSRCVTITGLRRGLKNARAEINTPDISAIRSFIREGELDAVITDPPWGMYRESPVPLDALYEKSLVLFSCLLKEGGRCVILTAARRELESAAAKVPGLRITRTFSVLVSGKKAAVYVLEK